MNNNDVVSSRYLIRKHVGRGGMQDVYLAVDQLLGLEVALKTPLAGQPDRRFIQSAKIAASVNHHNVAKTLDYFEENGRLFLIEEFVSGETLEVKLNRFGAVDAVQQANRRPQCTVGTDVTASRSVLSAHLDLIKSEFVNQLAHKAFAREHRLRQAGRTIGSGWSLVRDDLGRIYIEILPAIEHAEAKRRVRCWSRSPPTLGYSSLPPSVPRSAPMSTGACSLPGWAFRRTQRRAPPAAH